MKTFDFVDGKLVVQIDSDQDDKVALKIELDPLEFGDEVWAKVQALKDK